MGTTATQTTSSSRLAPIEKWVPGLRAVRSYQRAWLPRDLVAGLVLCALLVPQGMAYAELAGLPPITGLYTTVMCLVAYAAFGPSPYLVLGPDSSLGPMIAAVILPQVFSYTRHLCSEASRRPHVQLAAAKGLGRKRIFVWHVLLTVAPQLAALAGVSATLALTASIPIEVVCDSPGVGQLAWLAAMGRDLPLLVNITLIVTAITLAANSLSDWATSASGIERARP